MSYYITKTTAKAPIATFSDGADDVPTKSLVVTIPPTLSGVSALMETQTGRNLLNANGSSYTFQVGDNYRYNCGTVSLKKGVTYTFSALQEDALTSNTRNTLAIGVNEVYTFESATGTNYHNQSGVHSMQYTPSEDCEAVLLVWVHTPSNAVKYSSFMLEYGSTAHAYEQYQTPTTYTASLGRTIYGGQADIVNGVGTDENGNDFTFTGQEVPTRIGYNAFWSDEGDTEVTYYCLVESEELYTVTDTTLKNIADAIRTKTERTAPILVEDMDDEILSIVTGGGGEAERLCYLKCYNNDQREIPQKSQLVEDTKYSQYLSYDNSTRKFNVLQDFTAILVGWVYTYQTYEASRSDGSLYINDHMLGQYEAAGNAAGSKGGAYFIWPVKQGDTIYPYTPTRDGYPQQNMKIYLAPDQADGVWTFEDEEA